MAIEHPHCAGKKILLGITGSIAAYKAILLIRLLVKADCEVKVVITPAAKAFVSELVLETLSKNKVLCEISEEGTWANHVMLGRWADLMIIAPASCNTIAKMAAGICDNLLLAIYLSATCPVMLAPAMDEDMWKHPATKENLAKLERFGVKVLQVGNGELASGLTGEGRLAEPDEIMLAVGSMFAAGKLLAGKKAIVTAGPTYEAIDPVRFIGNHSSGLMGIEIATALMNMGAETTLILGPGSLKVPQGVNVIRITSAQQMLEAVQQQFDSADISVMAAAVADYRPAAVAKEKIKKTEDHLQINLVKNPDILSYCGHHKKPHQLVVGFALESNNEVENAKGKLAAKKADIIVLNSLRDENAGFGTSTNKISIFESTGEQQQFPLMTKKEISVLLADLMAKRLHEKSS